MCVCVYVCVCVCDDHIAVFKVYLLISPMYIF